MRDKCVLRLFLRKRVDLVDYIFEWNNIPSALQVLKSVFVDCELLFLLHQTHDLKLTKQHRNRPQMSLVQRMHKDDCYRVQ